MAFDILYRDSRDLTARPLRDRRARLEEVVAGSELVFPVRRLAADGLVAWRQVVERGRRRSAPRGTVTEPPLGPSRLARQAPSPVVSGSRLFERADRTHSRGVFCGGCDAVRLPDRAAADRACDAFCLVGSDTDEFEGGGSIGHARRLR